jgi:hypothetical protein
MSKPLMQILNTETNETIVREMTDDEYAIWQQNSVVDVSTPTKEQLMAQLAALSAQIQALE